MANRLSSRRARLTPADVAALDGLVPGGLHSSWLEFLLCHNVGVPERAWCDRERFAVAHFFGVSAEPGEDFGSALDSYDGRLAARHVPIGDADGGNLVCMDAKGRIFYWDHERHDRAVDCEKGLEGIEPPIQIALNLEAFLESLAPLPLPRMKAEDVVTNVLNDDFDELFQQHKIDDASS
jgi:hypothetical protein